MTEQPSPRRHVSRSMTSRTHFQLSLPEAPPAHPGKQLTVTVDGRPYARHPIRTRLVTVDDDLVEVVREYAAPYLRTGDVLVLSERMVAITQGRAYRIADLRPSRWARLLSRFISRSPYGIGLGSPWTMELAVREAGLPRILAASAAAAVTRPFGLRGVFYHVAGHRVNAIDGPCAYTLPPYDEYAILGPADPDAVAARLRAEFGVPVVIIDANDLGVDVLGVSDPSVTADFAAQVFRDNPLGQGRQQTPIGIVRPATPGPVEPEPAAAGPVAAGVPAPRSGGAEAA
jgi:hypothetical protein